LTDIIKNATIIIVFSPFCKGGLRGIFLCLKSLSISLFQREKLLIGFDVYGLYI